MANRVAPKPENVERLIYLVRGEKVMLDADLAALYGVEARALNQAVSRNRNRFPADFMFQLSPEEYQRMRSNFVTSYETTTPNSSQIVMSSPADESLRSRSVISKRRGGRRYLPYAFTEQGVAMLSTVLRSARAVEVNLAIMRTFVQLRRMMDSNRELARKIEAMERKYDEKFALVFTAIKRLVAEDQATRLQPKGRIGFGGKE